MWVNAAQNRTICEKASEYRQLESSKVRHWQSQRAAQVPRTRHTGERLAEKSKGGVAGIRETKRESSLRAEPRKREVTGALTFAGNLILKATGLGAVLKQHE